MPDLVIRNANIVDGTGAPAFHGDITVDGATITSVDAPGAAAKAAIGRRGRRAITAPLRPMATGGVCGVIWGRGCATGYVFR